MDITTTLYVTTAAQWRRWLTKHHRTESEIWLVFPKQGSGKPRIGYNEAVEQALCFGWIDSQVKGIDKDQYAQRFSKRRARSVWSESNLERMRNLIASNQMTAAGMEALGDAALLDATPVEIAGDVLRALKRDREVWENFQRFPAPYKRMRLAFIESRRSRGGDQFERSLRFFIAKTKRNVQYQFGSKQSPVRGTLDRDHPNG